MKNNNCWTKERRRKQAERCRANKPWQQSTGPKTIIGKTITSQNATKHGLRSQDGLKFRRLMHTQRQLVNQIIKQGAIKGQDEI